MILVFDIGATRTRLSLAQDGKLLEVVNFTTYPDGAGMDRIIGAMKEVAGAHKLEAVVGGMAGELEGPDGKLTLSINLPQWLGLPVLERVRQAFACPVLIGNDVVLGGLGEAHYGAGRLNGVMVYFTVSTGVNAVRLLDGRVDSTIKRFEIGFELISGREGRPESLESLVGGAATEARYGKPPGQLKDREIWQLHERNLAYGVYNALLFWTPDVVVFGGSMMRDIELEGVERELNGLVALPKRPDMLKAQLKDLAGLYGAMSWWEQHRYDKSKVALT